MKYALCFLVFIAIAGIWLLTAPTKRSTSSQLPAQAKDSAQITANEAQAIESLKAIQSAEATYQSTSGNGNFGSWEELVRGGLLPKDLVNKDHSGYSFRLELKPAGEQVVRSLLILAKPKAYEVTGRRTFSIDESGVIRFSVRRDAAVASLVPLTDEGGDIDANEASAVSTLRTIFSSEATYQATAGNGDFGSLKELGKEGLVNSVLAAGEKNGYLFKIRVEKASSESRSFFEAHAIPKTYGETGRKSFLVDESGTIRSADKNGKEAGANDEPIN
jgi:hypothetical protein